MEGSAVIVAAGLSSRLYPLTSETPKALLPLGDETLLARSLRLLRENGISRIAVVVGFRAESVRAAVGEDVMVITNPFYKHCNNMGSLFMARDFVGDEPVAYLHGDVAYSDRMLEDFLTASSDADGSCLDLLTAFGEVDDEAMKVRVSEENDLVESNKGIPLDEAAGEWTGIAVVHNPAVVFGHIEWHLMNESLVDYDTAAFTTVAAAGNRVRCLAAGQDPWKEIDTIEDLEAARAMFGARR